MSDHRGKYRMNLKNVFGRKAEYLTVFQDDIPEARIQALMLAYLMSQYYFIVMDINVKFWF